MTLKKIFPNPVLSGSLWLTWQLLNNTFSAGHMVLGAVLAIAIPILVQDFLPDKVCFQKPLLAFKFLGRLLKDIMIANMLVARWLLGSNKHLKPAFMRLRLDIQSPLGINILASTISLTPGTVSCDVSADGQYLLIHALHVDDLEKAVQDMKDRYEKPLLEMFKPC